MATETIVLPAATKKAQAKRQGQKTRGHLLAHSMQLSNPTDLLLITQESMDSFR